MDFTNYLNTNEATWQMIIETLTTIYPDINSTSYGILHCENLSTDESNRIYNIIDTAIKRNIRFYYDSEKEHKTKRKYLPMIKSDFVTQWQNIAYATAIVKGNNLTELYMNNFIDFHMHWKKERSKVDIYHDSTYIVSCVGAYKVFYEYFDYYERRMLGELYLDNPNNIVDLIVDNIDRAVYTAVVLDNYYISNSVAHTKNHSRLCVLFYGYDIEKRELYYIGFNKYNIFTTMTMHFKECIEAYEKNKLSFNEIDTYLQEFSLKENVWQYKFDFFSFVTQLERYTNSQKTETDELFEDLMYNRDNNALLYCGYDHYKNDFVYVSGIEVYNALICFLEYEIENNIPPIYQNFHAIYEHKKLLLERIMYVNTTYNAIPTSFICKLNQVVETLNKSRMLLLKCIYNKNNSDTKRLRCIVDNLKKCKEIEMEIFPQMIPLLQALL